LKIVHCVAGGVLKQSRLGDRNGADRGERGRPRKEKNFLFRVKKQAARRGPSRLRQESKKPARKIKEKIRLKKFGPQKNCGPQKRGGECSPPFG